MIVCICNCIREDQIRCAARRGAPTAEIAYRSLGHEPQCGTCLPHAEEIIAEERADLLQVNSEAA